MRVIYAGTPEFAAVALKQIIQAGHEIVLVLTQPDRAAGRGMKLQASPVKQLALQHDIQVAQPMSLRLDGKYPQDAQQAQQAILQAHADVMVVAAYGLILPQWVLDAPPQGCFNIHASLLPRWRGAAPIHRAIESGDAQTGVTIMQMDAGLDTGDMLLQQALDIQAQDTTATLHDKLAQLGGEMIVQALQQMGSLKRTPQPEQGVNYAHKIEKNEATIDWSQSAQVIARRVRAFNPFPGANCHANDEVVKVWQATPLTSTHPSGEPGEVIASNDHGIEVQCGQDTVLCLQQLQRAGGKRLAVSDFLRGFSLPVGMRLR